MADNVTLNAGSGGDVIATEDIAGVEYQKVKIADGTASSTSMMGVFSEDAATPATITGPTVMMERDDALATLTPIEGDWAGLRCTSTGALWVGIDGTAAVTQSGTWNITNVSGTVSLPTGASTAANQSTIIGHVDGIEGLLTTIDADTGSIATDASTIAGDTTSLDGKFAAGAALSDNFANPTTTGVGAFAMVWDGATWDRAPGDATNGLLVNLGANNDVTVSGTAAVTQSGTWNITNVSGTVSLPTGAATAANQSTAITALQLIDNPIVAHDAAASGSTGVNMAGAYATNSIEGLTQVAAADAARIVSDLNGVLVTRPHTTLEEIISERVSDTAGTSTNFTNFAAGGAGVHNYVTTISIYNSSATDGYVDFRDGSAGSIIFTAAAPAAGGSVINFPVPLKGAANTALAYDVSAALSTVYISVIGFQAQG